MAIPLLEGGSFLRSKCFPAPILVAGIKFLPDSPRYLVSIGRLDEAKRGLGAHSESGCLSSSSSTPRQPVNH